MKKIYTPLLLLLLLPVFTYAIDTAATAKKVPATGTELFVGIGLVSSTVTFSGEDELNGARSSGNLSPQINAGVDFYFDKYSKAAIFRVALGFNPGSKATLTTTYGGDISNGTSTSTEVLKYTQGTASLTPQLIWNFYNSKNLKVYIDAGFGIYVNMFSNKDYSASTHYSTSGTTITSQRVFPAMHSMVYNVPVQAGITLSNNINIYAGYIPKTSLNSEIGYSIDITRYQAGINYMFNIK